MRSALSIGKKPFEVKIIDNEFVLTLTRAVELNPSLMNLLGVKNEFNRPDTLDIHCDIITPCITIPKKNNTQILTRVNVKGEPYEMHTYTFDKSNYRDILTSEHLNTFTLSIKDVDDNLINFRGKTLDFVIEII